MYKRPGFANYYKVLQFAIKSDLVSKSPFNFLRHFVGQVEIRDDGGGTAVFVWSQTGLAVVQLDNGKIGQSVFGAQGALSHN